MTTSSAAGLEDRTWPSNNIEDHLNDSGEEGKVLREGRPGALDMNTSNSTVDMFTPAEVHHLLLTALAASTGSCHVTQHCRKEEQQLLVWGRQRRDGGECL
jgi:hypothetical protein